MPRRVKSICWHAGAALIVGLATGYFCRGIAPVPQLQGASEPRARTRDSLGEIIPPKGPTAVYMEEIAGISAARCEELFREMAGSGGSRDPVRLQCLFSRWLELEDPELVLGRLGTDNGFPEEIWTSPFFEAWAAMDYSGALAKADRAKFSGVRALVTLRHRDPAFLKESLTFWDPKTSRLAKELTTLGRENPELARQVATSQGRPDNSSYQIVAVAGGWASQDPQATLAWINSLELSPENRGKALNAIFTEWVKSDLPKAKLAFETSDLATKSDGRGRSMDEALGVLVTPETNLNQIFHSVQSDPFLDLAGLHRQLSESPIDWEKHQSVNPPIDRNGWFSTDPAKSAEEATRLPPGKTRDFLMSYICMQWADRDPAAALAYAKTHGLKAPYVRNDPTPEMTRAALAAPEETFANLLSTRQSDSAEHQMLRKMGETWFASAPQKASEWLIAQPEATSDDPNVSGSIQVELSNHLGYRWAKVDAVGASDWLENLPDGPQKQVACRAMLHHIGEYSPDLSFNVAASIIDGEQRSNFLQSHIKIVTENIGTPAARELLRNPSLSPAEQTTLSHFLDELPAKKR